MSPLWERIFPFAHHTYVQVCQHSRPPSLTRLEPVESDVSKRVFQYDRYVLRIVVFLGCALNLEHKVSRFWMPTSHRLNAASFAAEPYSAVRPVPTHSLYPKTRNDHPSIATRIVGTWLPYHIYEILPLSAEVCAVIRAKTQKSTLNKICISQK